MVRAFIATVLPNPKLFRWSLLGALFAKPFAQLFDLVGLKPLAGKRWREVRAIAAAARASGVAFELQASPKTSSVEIARDGVRALAGGDDGVVRLHDLAHRSRHRVVGVVEELARPRELLEVDESCRV